MQSKYFPVRLLWKYQTLLFVHCNIPQTVFCERRSQKPETYRANLCISIILYIAKHVAENGMDSNYLIIRVFISCYFCLKKVIINP